MTQAKIEQLKRYAQDILEYTKGADIVTVRAQYNIGPVRIIPSVGMDTFVRNVIQLCADFEALRRKP